MPFCPRSSTSASASALAPLRQPLVGASVAAALLGDGPLEVQQFLSHVTRQHRKERLEADHAAAAAAAAAVPGAQNAFFGLGLGASDRISAAVSGNRSRSRGQSHGLVAVLPQDAQFDAALMAPATSAGQLGGAGRRLHRPTGSMHSALMGSALGATSPLVSHDHGGPHAHDIAAATRSDVIAAPGPTLMAEDGRQPVLNVAIDVGCRAYN